jgi:hypothetical protein
LEKGTFAPIAASYPVIWRHVDSCLTEIPSRDGGTGLVLYLGCEGQELSQGVAIEATLVVSACRFGRLGKRGQEPSSAAR